MLIDLNVLLEYTDWERQKWRESLRQHGDRILLTTTGANSDARFETVGDLVRHIFSAEKMCLIKSPTVSKRASLFAPVVVSRILSPCWRSDSRHFWRSQSVYSSSTFRSMSI